MSAIWLHFEGDEPSELYRMAFKSSVNGFESKCVRGTIGIRNEGSFKWSPGVKALCLLFAKAHRAKLNQKKEEARIVGKDGSLASSLDYAISKQPNWLLDMFGVDSNGASLLRRLVRRINPERKRYGPVEVILPTKALDIHIFLDEREIEEIDQLDQLIASIEMHKSTGAAKKGKKKRDSESAPEKNESPKERDDNSPRSLKFLEGLILTEIQRSLQANRTFSRSRLQSVNTELLENPFCRKLIGSQARPLVSETELELSKSNLLGMSDDENILIKILEQYGPLTFFVTPAQVGSLAILYYLRKEKRLQIEISCNAVHTVAMSNRIVQQDFLDAPDFCGLSLGPACKLIGQVKELEYEPFMFMPSTSYRVVSISKGNEKDLNWGEGRYCFLASEESSSQFFFQELMRKQVLSKERIKVESMEPDEIFVALRNGDTSIRALQWFPYYEVTSRHIPDSNIAIEEELQSTIPTIYFMSKAFGSDATRVKALSILIRNAWLELRESPRLLGLTVREILADEKLRKLLQRSAGLYSLPAAEPASEFISDSSPSSQRRASARF